MSGKRILAMKFFLINTTDSTWGLTILGWTTPTSHRALLGLSGDSNTGSIWLDILFINITLREG